MTSTFQDRLIIALAKRGAPCPNLTVEDRGTSVRFSMPRNGASALYGMATNYTVEKFAKLSDLDDKFDANVQDIAERVRSWKSQEINNNKISTMDAFFNISRQGRIEVPFMADTVLINVLERGGMTIERLLSDIHRSYVREFCTSRDDVHRILGNSFTNVDPDHMEKYFYKWYSDLNEFDGYEKVLPFNGCVNGKHMMAFNIRLAKGVHYSSSVSPTITLRNRPLPETVLASLKGRQVNDLLDEQLFSEDVIIKNSNVSSGVISLTISPDRTDITHLGRHAQPLRKAA